MRRTNVASTLIYQIAVVVLFFFLLMGCVLVVRPGTAVRAQAQGAPSVGGCPLYPADNIWNRDISTLPVHPNSANFINSIGLTGHVHADFGSGLYNGEPIGIPFAVVSGNQPAVPVSFSYSDESDPGPYPIPANVPIEGGAQSTGDRHVIVVDSATCKLYEMFNSFPQSNGSWKADSGAVWNLNSNALRPRKWTSADAAGLPILAGLARYDEVAAGAINHALRFTVSKTQRAFLWPARHYASSSTNPNLPPMGLRLRLKASVNVAAYPPQSRVILTALQHYGMIVADNGSSWFISGAPDSRWNNDDLAQLKNIHGSDFEVVDESKLQVSANSAQSFPANYSSMTIPPLADPTSVSVIAPLPTATPLDTRKGSVILYNNTNGGASTNALFFSILTTVAVVLLSGAALILFLAPRYKLRK
ncbi:MAG TPA: hypothetical protein VKY19_15985 [Ktedonosporobacter sp.]|jgi:hypothetical protein|nr:hypothetical protein [Ktedonosporobacter sp.]